MSHILRQGSCWTRLASNAPTRSLPRTFQAADTIMSCVRKRKFHNSRCLEAVRPYLLADIGEGITQCQIMSWAVQPGEKVHQFDLICEVQSDKASVEITSRYDGTIKKLHYEVDDMADVGSPLLDIDVEGEEDESPLAIDKATDSSDVMHQITDNFDASVAAGPPRSVEVAPIVPQTNSDDKVVPLSPVQRSMFQTMTEAVNIPHFLYTQVIDFTELTSFRKRVADGATQYEKGTKLSALPFVMKALSKTIQQFPIVNSSIDTKSGLKHPAIIEKAAHNIGVAMDTPKGLVVPVVRNVQEHTVFSLNKELQRLRDLAAVGKLSSSDMSDATIVVSNIGSIGGHVVAPVILPPTVMILGVGRSREVPAFRKDKDGKDEIVKREEVVLSWSADHRVLDGATVAKAAQKVGSYIENTKDLATDSKSWDT